MVRRMVRRIVIVCLAAAPGLSGCDREAGVKPPQVAQGEIVWLSPDDGDHLADTLRMEVTVESANQVRFRVGDSTIATVARPPWRCAWLPSGDARTVELAAETDDAERSAAIRVHWSPNAPPSARWIGVTAWPGVDRGGGDSLRVAAIDPEDGPLGGDAIDWLSDRQGLLGRGSALPVEALVPGTHTIRARARDRWGRAAAIKRRIFAFDFSGDGHAEGVVEDLRHSWLAGDFDRYIGMLADRFRFVFCAAERERDPQMPAMWERRDEERFARGVQGRPNAAVVRFNWTRAEFRLVRLPGGDWRQAEICGIALDMALGPADTLRVRGGQARVWLRRGGDGDPWRVEQWSDLGAEGDATLGRIRRLMEADGGSTGTASSPRPTKSAPLR